MSFCPACEWLRENAPNFVLNGITEIECNYLKSDDGLIGVNNNATDLQTMIDCLIGNHAEELQAVQLCDIKDWLAELMENLWQLKTAWACNERGQWNNIWEIRNVINDQNNRITNIERTLNEFLTHLSNIGVWDMNGTPSSDTTIGGSWQGNRRIAGGNINLFGTANENDRFIRTNNTPGNANDIRGGL